MDQATKAADKPEQRVRTPIYLLGLVLPTLAAAIGASEGALAYPGFYLFVALCCLPLLSLLTTSLAVTPEALILRRWGRRRTIPSTDVLFQESPPSVAVAAYDLRLSDDSSIRIFDIYRGRTELRAWIDGRPSYADYRRNLAEAARKRQPESSSKLAKLRPGIIHATGAALIFSVLSHPVSPGRSPAQLLLLLALILWPLAAALTLRRGESLEDSQVDFRLYPKNLFGAVSAVLTDPAGTILLSFSAVQVFALLPGSLMAHYGLGPMTANLLLAWATFAAANAWLLGRLMPTMPGHFLTIVRTTGIATAFAAAVMANVFFDGAAPASYQAMVAAKHSIGLKYALALSHVATVKGADGQAATVLVDAADFDALQVGATTAVAVHSGLFGTSWLALSPASLTPEGK